MITPDLSRPLVALPLLFGAGVLTSLTPCVYPMIPITVALVGGESTGVRSRWRPFTLTLSYAIGLALVYAMLGVLAGLSGTLFGTVSTNPWLLFAMGNLLLLFALVMLDALPLPIPAWVMRRAADAGSGGGLGVAVGSRLADGEGSGACVGPGDSAGVTVGSAVATTWDPATVKVGVATTFGSTGAVHAAVINASKTTR
ncbi:MAG: sulfite exporter TauE/SafE family protein, partial [Gemmatimonadaceae bacterium]|nr:sulfite exporter TauE/SafE family protein [Gemmatimonadaceae bacterium]